MFNTFEYTGKMWNDLVDGLDLANGWTVECTTHHMQSNDYYTITHNATGKHLEVKLLSDMTALTDDGSVYYYDDACDCWEDDEDCGGYCAEFALNNSWLIEVRILDGFAACGCCYAEDDDDVDGFYQVATREDFEKLFYGLANYTALELPPVLAEMLAEEIQSLAQWKTLASWRGLEGFDLANGDDVAALFEKVAAA